MTNSIGQSGIVTQGPLLEGLDSGFLHRTLRTTLILGAVLTTWLIQTLDIPVLGGFASGVLLGAGGLALTMWTVDRTTRSDARFRAYIPAGVMLAKLVLIFGALRVLIGRWHFSVPAFAVGVSLVIVVIVLKVIGRVASAPRAGSMGMAGPRSGDPTSGTVGSRRVDSTTK